MTFNDDAKIDSGRVKRRGKGALIGGGGGIGVIIVVFIISQVTGVDLSGLAGGGGGSNGSDTEIANCETGEQANADLDCRLNAASDALDTYWPTQVDNYRTTTVILFDDQTNTGCGAATSAVGPFYCPADEIIYIDTDFYAELRTTYGASGGPLAEMYVLAHEWGHHIQNVLGTMDGLDQSATGPESDSVRLELQADCYAGSWVGAATQTDDGTGTTFLEPISSEELAQALSAASAVGDDRIQGTEANSETWTHGSSEKRQKWFTAGYEGGPSTCDTFAVATP
jgi:predicted metalloprotease